MDEKKPGPAAAAGAKPKDEPAKTAVKPAGGKINGNMILLGVIVVIGISLQIMLPKFLAPPKAMNEETEEKDAAHGGEAVHAVTDESTTEMGTTTAEAPIEVLVNIAGTDGERYLKAALVLEYVEPIAAASPKKAAGHGAKKEEEGPEGMAKIIMQRMPKYKNYLLETLSKMTMAELTAPETKEKIKRDFLLMVSNTIPPKSGVVKGVYFTQYIIQ